MNPEPDRLADLERRVTRLESEAWRLAFPQHPTPLAIDNEHCRMCGGAFKDMTNYVCFNPQCPNAVTRIYSS